MNELDAREERLWATVYWRKEALRYRHAYHFALVNYLIVLAVLVAVMLRAAS